jgi:hypothetical protein
MRPGTGHSRRYYVLLIVTNVPSLTFRCCNGVRRRPSRCWHLLLQPKTSRVALTLSYLRQLMQSSPIPMSMAPHPRLTDSLRNDLSTAAEPQSLAVPPEDGELFDQLEHAFTCLPKVTAKNDPPEPSSNLYHSSVVPAPHNRSSQVCFLHTYRRPWLTLRASLPRPTISVAPFAIAFGLFNPALWCLPAFELLQRLVI